MTCRLMRSLASSILENKSLVYRVAMANDNNSSIELIALAKQMFY
jgi:hypothetical protein